MHTPDPALTELERLCEECGGTDVPYLRHHFGRFAVTKEQFLSTWPRERGTRVLDIGAHWLHQASLWANDGFEVTALDLPITFEMACVQRLAERLGIRLLPNADLAQPAALDVLPESSIDIVLFTEILEHLTFNPVDLWKAVYRVLKPGGRILVTTPNYYSLYGRAWAPGRFLKGFGGGLDAWSILSLRSLAYHWKEYSRREVIYYFAALTGDWVTTKALCCDDKVVRKGGVLAEAAMRLFPGLRPNLHVEIELIRKDKGIQIEPHW